MSVKCISLATGVEIVEIFTSTSHLPALKVMIGEIDILLVRW